MSQGNSRKAETQGEQRYGGARKRQNGNVARESKKVAVQGKDRMATERKRNEDVRNKQKGSVTRKRQKYGDGRERGTETLGISRQPGGSIGAEVQKAVKRHKNEFRIAAAPELSCHTR